MTNIIRNRVAKELYGHLSPLSKRERTDHLYDGLTRAGLAIVDTGELERLQELDAMVKRACAAQPEKEKWS